MLDGTELWLSFLDMLSVSYLCQANIRRRMKKDFRGLRDSSGKLNQMLVGLFIMKMFSMEEKV